MDEKGLIGSVSPTDDESNAIFDLMESMYNALWLFKENSYR